MDKQILSITSVGRDFLLALEMGVEQPSIDSFLDYRFSVMNQRDKSDMLLKPFYRKEIKAIDEIIKYLIK